MLWVVSVTVRESSECPGKEIYSVLTRYRTLFIRRHLLRLWLCDPDFEWEKHETLKERFDRVYVELKIENSVFPLEATI